MPRTLPSSSTAALVFSLLIVLGAALWVIGGRMQRSSKAASTLTWTHAVLESETPVDAPTRLDVIERLAMVGAPWCVAALESARAQERDRTLRDAADRALLVIAARG